METRQGVRAGVGVIVVLAVAACSSAGAATTIPAVPAATQGPSALPSPSPVPSLAPSPSPVETATPVVTAAPTVSSAPSKSAKPLPSIDQADLDSLLTSSITLIDLADADLAVTVSYLDPGSDESFDLGRYVLGSTDQMTSQVPAGTYRLDFRQPSNSTTGPSCTIEIDGTDGYVFAAVQDAVAISRTGTTPKNVGELFISTSSLCGK